MFSFLGGAAAGASKELEGQEDRAFKLKLQNAQIEGQLANAKSLSDYERPGEVATTDMSGGAQSGRANKADQEWWMQKNKDKTTLKALGLKAEKINTTGMTREKFNEIYQVVTPGDPNEWINNTEVVALKQRLAKEEPTADQDKSYRSAMKAKKLIAEMWALREAAKKEGGAGGIVSGAIGTVGKYTRGAVKPKTAGFLTARDAISTELAKILGDVGNIAKEEATRAAGIIGDQFTADESAQIQFDLLNSMLDSSAEAQLKASAGLRRRIQREQEGTNMKSLSDARRAGQGESTPLDLDAVEEAIRAMEQEEKDKRKPKGNL